jgi:hypothetical protein
MPNIYKCTAIIIQLCIFQFKVDQQEILQNKANLMVITIYGNSKKSHDQIDIIFEFSSKNGSEWYTIL